MTASYYEKLKLAYVEMKATGAAFAVFEHDGRWYELNRNRYRIKRICGGEEKDRRAVQEQRAEPGRQVQVPQRIVYRAANTGRKNTGDYGNAGGESQVAIRAELVKDRTVRTGARAH